jgi:hypothetical protein
LEQTIFPELVPLTDGATGTHLPDGTEPLAFKALTQLESLKI